ncbi:MAG: S9 family peptidase [Planctomycetota bacterium]
MPTSIALGLLFIASCTRPLAPPMAKCLAHEQIVHGATRADDYFWLHDRNDPDVVAYLNAENNYTEAMTKATKSLQEKLYKEMKGRIKETDLSVPTKIDDYFYYTRTVQGMQYPMHCRKQGSLEEAEEILLDQNDLAAGEKYFRVGAFEVSPDHKLLAFSTDTDGSETYVLRVKDLPTGRLLADEIPKTYYGVVWANDNQHLFYTTLDDAKRPFRVWRHKLGDPASSDALVHHEKDEKFHVGLEKTLSRKYVLMELRSQVTNEVRFLDADRPTDAFKVIEPRSQGMEYSVAHHGGDFYVVTNDNAVNFKLMKTPLDQPGKANWSEVIGHRSSVKIDGVTAFAKHLVIDERRNGLKAMRVRELDGGGEHQVEFPEPVYAYWLGPNEEFDSQVIRFTYTSLVTPRSVFDYDMETRGRELRKQDEVLGGFDASRYQSERITATATDGTKVPISLVYRKGLRRNGGNPTLLYGYGSYGASSDPTFQSNRLSLLDRGVVFAIAHVRGGGEMGRPWYEAGKLMNKKNTFTDFVACAEHLIAEKYASPGRLAIQGGSAGGLLMGAVTNLRPDLFKVVVAQVPFVDVVNTMLDEALPLTVIEYEEWGNPDDRAHYDYMMTYSPYDNVAAKAYPDILVTAGLNDPRVSYHEPAKWTAKLRRHKTGGNVLLLKTNMGAGHGGASGRYDAMKDTAFIYAFVLERLGIRS